MYLEDLGHPQVRAVNSYLLSCHRARTEVKQAQAIQAKIVKFQIKPSSPKPTDSALIWVKIGQKAILLFPPQM